MGNNGLIEHAASADQSDALLQRPSPTKFKITVATVYQGLTGFIDCRAVRARRLRELARLRMVQAPACDQCRRPPAVRRRPNQPMLMAPAEARRESLHHYYTDYYYVLLQNRYCVLLNHYCIIIASLLHHYCIIITSSSHHHHIIITSSLRSLLLHFYYIIITHDHIDYYYVLSQIHNYVILHPYYVIITLLLQMGNLVIMIPLLRASMRRVSLYYYTIVTYYYVIIIPGSIITHYYQMYGMYIRK